MGFKLRKQPTADLPATPRDRTVTRQEALRALDDARRATEALARFDRNPNEGYETPEQSE
jgi:hypothetical protein